MAFLSSRTMVARHPNPLHAWLSNKGTKMRSFLAALSATYVSALLAGVKTNNYVGLRSGLFPKGNLCSLTLWNDLSGQESIVEYIDEFVRKTNDGRLFNVDWSKLVDTKKTFDLRGLIPEERRERGWWAKNRSGLRKHYTIDNVRKNLTPKEMLLLRVVPPILTDLVISRRGAFDDGRKRLYLDKICAWKGFANEVESFTAPQVEGETTTADVLFSLCMMSRYVPMNTMNGAMLNATCLTVFKTRVC